MQAAKKAVENMKETAANMGASAKSGMEKTKATVQEKTERMNTDDPMQKEMATLKKEERIHQAEAEKQQAREHNAAVKQSTNDDHVTNTDATKPSANADNVSNQSHHHSDATKPSANVDHMTNQCNHHTNAETAIGDYGCGQPMATDHVSTIPTLGFGNEVPMCSHSIDTNTKANNVHLAETQPGSAPAKY
ncbi:18 kDa seed maturation protein-like [Trifolium pratense]|nr:18 kDa seed maturation protein-like [Trifolium pratense]